MNTDYPYIVELQQDCRDHGEVHAVVEDHDAELELRDGTTEFHYERGCLTVEGPDTTHVVNFDDVVRHYRPMSVFHK